MSINTVTIVLHLISAVVWVGGMFFAYLCLRPAAASVLNPPLRLQLWVRVFARFFPWVWLAVILLPITGYLMIFNIFGGMASSPLYVHLMNALGTVMILIYLHVFFAPYRRLREAVTTQNWPEGGKQLSRIRILVGINTTLGLLVILIASGGRYFG